MNSRLAKFERRTLRKFIGASAVQAVAQQGAITEETIIPALTSLQELAQNAATRLEDLEAKNEAVRIRDLTVWGRLRWILRGE